MTDIAARDAACYFHQTGSSPCLGAVVEARGIWITDAAGQRLIDLHGNTAHHLGYGHPRLIAALKSQLDGLSFSPRRYANEPATRLAELLTARFRNGRSRMFLMRSGSEAIEAAIRLTRIATGRSGILAFEGSYHGHGMGSLGLSSSQLDPRLGSQLPDIHHAANYWHDSENAAAASLASIAACLRQNGNTIACLVAEPIRSNCHVPPPHFWPSVAGMCKGHGVKIIFDEIPSGLGKTGRLFAHEHFGVTPDVVVLGKSLGGGMLPVAAVLGDDALNIAPELAVGHYTHEKNPLLAQAALTTLEIIADENLVERASLGGAYLERRVQELAADGLPLALRGLGLLRAIVFTDGRTGADALSEQLRDFGVSCVAKDESSIGFSPPLIITNAEIEDALSRVVKCLRAQRVVTRFSSAAPKSHLP